MNDKTNEPANNKLPPWARYTANTDANTNDAAAESAKDAVGKAYFALGMIFDIRSNLRAIANGLSRINVDALPDTNKEIAEICVGNIKEALEEEWPISVKQAKVLSDILANLALLHDTIENREKNETQD